MALKIGLPPAEFYRQGTPGLDAVIREIRDQKRVAIDTETTGLVNWRDIPLFWSLSWGHRRICLHNDVLTCFHEAFGDPDKEWVLQNAKYDMHMLANVGIVLAGKIIDIRVMHCLLYEEDAHTLEFMSKQLLKWSWKDGLSDWDRRKMPNVGDYWLWLFETDPQKLIQYASNDAYGTMQLYEVLKVELERAWCHSLYPKDYSSLWDIFYKTEVPFTKVLWTCERNGLFLDTAYLKSKEVPASKKVADLRKEMTTLFQAYKPGTLFNPNSVPQVRGWFFEHEGRKPLKMTKGGKTGVKAPSADSDFLEYYACESEMAKLLLEYREVDKALGTYIVGLQNSDALDPHGMIHPTFNQDVARTGRLSSSDPNGQNIGNPEKDKFRVRGAFRVRPDEDETLIAADQSQLEMRLLAAAAGEQDMIKIFMNGWDIHIGNAAMVFNVPYEDIKAAKKKKEHELTDYDKKCLEYRRRIKNVGFGLPVVRPNSKPLKTVNPDSFGKGNAVVCRSTDRIDLVASSATSTERPYGLASHASCSVDTGAACKVRLSEWESSNGRSVLAASDHSPRQARTANDACAVVESIISLCVRNDGSERTKRRATTRRARTTTPGGVEARLRTTERSLSRPTVRLVSAVLMRRSSSTTRTEIDTTLMSQTWRYCANGAISLSTTAQRIYRSRLHAAGSRNARRHSQYQQKYWSHTLNYGMKERKLAADLNLSLQEAQALIKKYMDRYPAVQHFYKESVENARKYGYAFTLLGRRRCLPELGSPNSLERWQAERQATNLEIQGTAADVMKMAMIHLHNEGMERWGCYMALQVHDELVFRCNRSYLDTAKRLIKERMEHPLPTELAVPLIITMDVADDWAATKGLHHDRS